MKKRVILVMVLFSLTVFGNVPDRVYYNIERASSNQDNRNLYIRTQERAYNRILSLGKKEGLSEEKIDTEVKRLEKRYGTDYEIIYKNFYYSVKELSKNEKKIVEAKKMNEEKKEEYKELIKKTELPSDIKDYVEKEATNKYPDNYSERIKYIEDLIKFYNFIKK